MKNLTGLLLSVAVLVPTIVSAQPINAVADPSALPAPSQPASGQTKSVQLSRVIFNPEISRENQRTRVGTICLFSGGPLSLGSTERSLDAERFERLFSAAMSEHRFNVVTRTTNLFDDAEATSADYLVGGTMRLRTITLCDSVSGQKGNVTIAVEWQIYDRARRTVVETVTTEGSARVEAFNRDGLNLMLNNAFSASIASLIEQGSLQKHVGTPAA